MNAKDKTCGKEEFFHNAKYGMFIHWGLFADIDNEWEGKNYDGISEWLMARAKIKPDEYEKQALSFNPDKFNAEEWVKTAQAAGMRYMVITSKHHDGFAMFKSAHPFNIVDSTPFKRDPMRELSDACAKLGMPFGFYYSHCVDWHERNSWGADKISFNEYFENKCLPQIRELLSNYGKLCMIWFDLPGEMSKEQTQQIVDLVRELQPETMINGRVGHNLGDYTTLDDNEIPYHKVEGLWEAINTTNDSWGYSSRDKNFIAPKEVLSQLINVAARGGNYLLNIGPDGKGQIPYPVPETLKIAGNWLKRHGDTVYNAEASPWHYIQTWGDCTRKGNTLFFHVFNWIPGAEIRVCNFPGAVKSVALRGKKKGSLSKLEYKLDKGSLVIELPLKKRDELVSVIEVELASNTEMKPGTGKIAGVEPDAATTVTCLLAKNTDCVVHKYLWMERFGEWKNRYACNAWKDSGSLAWTLYFYEPGEYRIFFSYCELFHQRWLLKTDEGNALDLFLYKNDMVQGVRRFIKCPCGIIKIEKPGVHTLTLVPQFDPLEPELKGGASISEITLERYS